MIAERANDNSAAVQDIKKKHDIAFQKTKSAFVVKI
jgi:hypothetical protein